MKILKENDLDDFIRDFKVRKPRVYKGLLIDEYDHCDSNFHYFTIFGRMSDGMACYREVNKDGSYDESDTRWFSRGTRVINGYKVNIFTLEAID